MKKNTRKILAFLLTCAMSVSMVACGGNTASTSTDDSSTKSVEATATEETKEETKEVAETETTEVVRDLGGMEITIGNWWGDYDVTTFKPENSRQEATLDWRTEIQEKYNFKMKEVTLGGWAEIQELASTSIMAGDPAASIIILEPRWFVALNNQGLFYPVSECPSVDLSTESPVEWNKNVIDGTTYDGKTYGFAVGYSEGGGVYFNKRLFAEAGLDPDLPYDLQKSGEWDWNKFMELSKTLTRDTDNDGVMDTYGVATFSKDLLDNAVSSNKAQYVDKDEQGNFVNGTNTPEFMQALQFAVNIYKEGVLMPQPEGSEWNWFDDAFLHGQAAMRTSGTYFAGNLADMADDWGFVAFPKGPTTDKYNFFSGANVNAIPNTYSAEEADAIMFAYNLWMTDPEGFDDPDDWKTDAYVRFRDTRAVDESLVIEREFENSLMPYHTYIPALEPGDIAYKMWADDADPAQIVETVSQSWNSIIAESNK